MEKVLVLTVDANIKDFGKVIEESKLHHGGREMYLTLAEWINENKPQIVFGTKSK